MPESNLNAKVKAGLDNFVMLSKSVFGENLICVILYGSASTGEFIYRQSNLNLLVALNEAGLENLKAIRGLINKAKFRFINPLFLSQDYIKNSADVFPIEFLDMKENYRVLYGQDVLKDISIDTKNLRYQCEHELKGKVIALKRFFLSGNRGKDGLLAILLKSFTSITHILKNILRIKGKAPPYLRRDILRDLSLEFPIDRALWERLLALRNKEIKIGGKEIEESFVKFVDDCEKIIGIVDKL